MTAEPDDPDLTAEDVHEVHAVRVLVGSLIELHHPHTAQLEEINGVPIDPDSFEGIVTRRRICLTCRDPYNPNGPGPEWPCHTFTLLDTLFQITRGRSERLQAAERDTPGE